MFEKLNSEILEGLRKLSILDTHTHLTCGKLGARGLHDILLYHMVIADLYTAGCPNGARLTEFPGYPSEKEAHTRLKEAIPYLKNIRNTSCFWGVRTILKDLYNWTEEIDSSNWKDLDNRIRERANDRSWHREIAKRAGIQRFTTELARREGGVDDDMFQYSMEWAFFTRTQRSEFDSALYELERCWGHEPGSPIPHSAGHRPKIDRMIKTLDDVKAAMAHYITKLVTSPVLSMATHISSDISFRQVSDTEMVKALKKRANAGVEERDIYASYIHEAFLKALEPYADRIVFQFSLAAEPLPFNTASIVPQKALTSLAEIVARHPRIKFHCFEASRHANQSICSMCRGLPNLSVAAYWWHNFFPGAICQILEERLDMLAANCQVGFFSDAYCIEWSYAKAEIIKRQMAQVLAKKVAMGQYSQDEALAIARDILYGTAQYLLKMEA
ncbi:MAG: glucuronate isomerase [Smithella sp. PtaU1.Bin162]|nr:MAG: glucuronate isomerase [Smithella sp. PtaU1.Bin162]